MRSEMPYYLHVMLDEQNRETEFLPQPGNKGCQIIRFAGIHAC